ncbi:MAG: hypothetical protein ACT4N2_05665 [Hyphomicrobium sp.]
MSDEPDRRPGEIVALLSTIQREEDHAPPLPNRSDHLTYLADMILELRDLSQKSGFNTLAAMLQLAHAEATHQARAARR